MSRKYSSVQTSTIADSDLLGDPTIRYLVTLPPNHLATNEVATKKRNYLSIVLNLHERKFLNSYFIFIIQRND